MVRDIRTKKPVGHTSAAMTRCLVSKDLCADLGRVEGFGRGFQSGVVLGEVCAG